MAFILNSITVKNPHKFKISRYKISNLKRLMSGDMGGSQITSKRKFFFTYEAITSSDWNIMLSAIWDGPMFFSLSVPYQGSTVTATVYVGEIPSELHDGHFDDGWVWKGVTFNLIEK